MQAKELERNQDPPSPAQSVRRQRSYFPNRTNTRTDHGLYDTGCLKGVKDKNNFNINKVDISQNRRDVIAAELALSHIVSEEVHYNSPNSDYYSDSIFFQREIYLFLFYGRKALSIYWGKMTTSAGLYLNERDIETISYLAAGYGAKEIAREFNLSPRTVEHRIETLKRRLGARNVTHLIAMVLLAKPVRNSGMSDSRGE